MPRNGLSEQRVTEAAAQLIEEKGRADFSMRALADSLHVKTASLYNHVESMDSLLLSVCAYTLQQLRESQLQAIQGQRGLAAIPPLAQAYRRFAKKHRECYRLMMSLTASCGDALSSVSFCLVEPFLLVLDDSSLSESEKIHWQRVLRGIIHGFVSQEEAGFFSHLPASVEDSFQTAIQCYIDGLTQAEKRKQA